MLPGSTPGRSAEDELRLRLLEDQHRQARRKARLVGALAGGLAASFLAYVLFFSGDGVSAPPATLNGSIEVDGSAPVDLAGGTCRSGFLSKFRGVDLASRDGGWTIRILEDSLQGHRIRLARGESVWELQPADCQRFTIRLRDLEGRLDDGRAYAGSMQLICQLESGALRASARFDNCYE